MLALVLSPLCLDVNGRLYSWHFTDIIHFIRLKHPAL